MRHVTLFVNTVAKNGTSGNSEYVTVFPCDAFCSRYNHGYNGYMGIMVLRFYDTSVSNYLNPNNKHLSGTVRSQTTNCFNVFNVVLLSGTYNGIWSFRQQGVLSTGVCVCHNDNESVST